MIIPATQALSCEYQINPLGIDTMTPRLSWETDDPRPGAVQKQYQLQVATDPDFSESRIVWDTTIRVYYEHPKTKGYPGYLPRGAGGC